MINNDPGPAPMEYKPGDSTPNLQMEILMDPKDKEIADLKASIATLIETTEAYRTAAELRIAHLEKEVKELKHRSTH